jgi:Flp pilus assembly protein TadG
MQLGNFVRHRAGSVAVITGILATVVFGAAGIAVDFVNASYVRTSLQQALDGAVLAASASQVKNRHEAEMVIDEYMTSNWKQKFPDLAVDVNPTLGDHDITGVATTHVPTLLAGVLGIQEIAIHVTSTATAPDKSIEVAMVIDNSSSMRSHLSLLRESLLAVVETLALSPIAGDVKFAVVPYSIYVNVGTSNKNKSWLAFTGVDKSTWEGCVGSRDYPLELEDSDSTPIPAIDSSRCNPTALLPLTDDVDDVKSWIDDLEAEVDDTYMASGLIWGVRALSERDPLDEGAADGDTEKILIFLTDGYSTVGPSYPKHENEDTAGDAFGILEDQCTNAKAQGITIYTVAFEASSYNKGVLERCASSSSHAYEASAASDLVTAFSAIAAKLSTIYLSQ